MARPPSEGSAGEKRQSTFHPCLWGDFFVTFQPPLLAQRAQMQERAGVLVEQVRTMMKDSNEIPKILNLILTLERLCLDYRFENEIKQLLDVVSNSDYDDNDLQLVSNRFYLLRKNRYDVSSDVFRKFQDKDGKFGNSDTQSLLSLYNAAQMRIHGEGELDEAVTFARGRLQAVLEHLESPLAEEVSSALDTPLFTRVAIIQARSYIPRYEKEPTRSDPVLELAKLNFNLLQFHFCEELKEITQWWRKLNAKSNLWFVRDRIVETYYWMSGGSCKPENSFCRVIATKIVSFITIIDDIFDTYASTEESMQLAEAIYRWDESALDLLPEYMKEFYLYLLETFNSAQIELGPEKSYRVIYLKEAMKQLVRSYSEELTWRDRNYVPTVSDHLKVSMISIGNVMVATSLFAGMDEPTVETFKWALGDSRLMNSFGIFVRLTNDVVSTKREQTGVHIASTVQSYMKEHGTTKEVACEKLKELIDDSWKDMLTEFLAPTDLPLTVPQMILNISKASANMYKCTDFFTTAGELKDKIREIFVEPLE